MDPFTIAAGISAVGSLFKGITSFFGGNNASQAEKNAAQQADMESGVNAQEALQSGDVQAAHGAVAAAANGGGFVGSSIGVIQNLSNQAMFNARAQIYRGQTEAQRDLYQAAVDKAQGLQGLVSGVISASGSVAGGFMKSAALSSTMSSIAASKGDAGVSNMMFGGF